LVAQIAWRIEWRGKEWTVCWQDGTLTSNGSVAEAFARFAVSNAPETDVPAEKRLANATAMRALMPQFADAVLSESPEQGS